MPAGAPASRTFEPRLAACLQHTEGYARLRGNTMSRQVLPTDPADHQLCIAQADSHSEKLACTQAFGTQRLARDAPTERNA